jgi:hypothetical protein
MAGRLPVPPPAVDRGGSLLGRPGGRFRQELGKLAPAVVVVHGDQVPARPKDAQHLRQARLSPWREEVGEPRVHNVRARVRQRDVLGGAGKHHGSRQAGCRPFSCCPQSRIGFHPDHACCPGGIIPEPVASAAAQIDEGLAGPGSNGAHRGQHVPGPVDCCILQLVTTGLAADVRREPPVRELRGGGSSESHAELSATSVIVVSPGGLYRRRTSTTIMEAEPRTGCPGQARQAESAAGSRQRGGARLDHGCRGRPLSAR